MLHFSGVVQLAAIVKEDATKNGEKIVYFTAFSRRGEQSDKVFCKCFGKTAEYLMRNLTKKSDGKYVSRKLSIAGSLETYKQSRMEKLSPVVITPQHLDPQLGILHESIQIVPSREFEEEKFMLKISYLDFEDKKKESEIIEIHRSSADFNNPIVNQSSNLNTTNDSQTSNTGSLASSLNEATMALNEPDLSGIV